MILKNTFNNNLNKILSNLDELLDSTEINDKSVLIELNQNELIQIKPSKNKQSLKINYGFPFPIYSETKKPNFKKECSVNIFFRGKKVRLFQREELISMTQNYTEWNDKFAFQKLFQDKIKQTDRIIYVDPYDFIGDSYSGLEMLDSLIESINEHDATIFSKLSQHHNHSNNMKPYTIQNILKEIKPYDLIMKPDFLESHWQNTIETISCMKNNSIAFIPGRHLIVEKKKNEIIIDRLKTPDLFLCNSNIEDYMSECLDSFGIKKSAKINKRPYKNTFSFFINPFANDKLRFINPKLVFETYKNILQVNEHAEMHIIGGYHHDIQHHSWISNFFEFMKQENNLYRINVNYYNNLTQISKHMQERKCSALLTADTSIAHAANRWGYPNVTVHNTKWWDQNSIQSLVGSSPIGFNRYFLNQMPLIDYGDVKDHIKLGKIAADALLFLQKSDVERKSIIESLKINTPNSLEEHSKLQKEISYSIIKWASEMYDPQKLLEEVMTKKIVSAQLIKTATKISPLYKLAKFNSD
ncbi:MAG: hypothetical protein ABIC91_00255 [Nanoarchaeota archaeon]|nr:hypothetical protein [Nanoarchaeota archaeon]